MTSERIPLDELRARYNTMNITESSTAAGRAHHHQRFADTNYVHDYDPYEGGDMYDNGYEQHGNEDDNIFEKYLSQPTEHNGNVARLKSV